MQIIESKLLTSNTDVVNSPSKALSLVLKATTCLDLTLRAILLDKKREALGNMELVRVGVWLLRFPQLLDGPGPKFKVLLVVGNESVGRCMPPR